MKFSGGIFFGFNPEKGLHIELRDWESRFRFLEVDISKDNLVRLFSNQMDVECAVELDEKTFKHLGKTKEMQKVTYKIPDDLAKLRWDSRFKASVREFLKLKCLDGWEPSYYLDSSSTFTYKDGDVYVNSYIMRWVEVENKDD